MTREGMTLAEWLNYIHSFRPNDKIIVEANTFSGPSEGVITKVCFKGNCNDRIFVENGFSRELSVYDIRSIEKQG